MNSPFFTSDSPIVLMILVGILGASIAAFLVPEFLEQNLFRPYSVARGRRLPTIITSAFIHLDIQHLVFNVLSYLFFAFRLQTHVGEVGFFMIYFGSILFSKIPTLIMYRNTPQYSSLGASGAVSGVVLSYILFEPTARMGLLFIPGLRMPAYVFGMLYLAYSYYMSRNRVDNINHDAHLWGALGGIAITLTLKSSIMQDFLRMLGVG